MNIPFTIEQFLQVMENYNLAVWPMQIVHVLLALAAVYLVFSQVKKRSLWILLILSFFWLWIGIVYHLLFFTEINQAAYAFGGLFILQGLLFLYLGIKNKVSFAFKKDAFGITGIILIVYALAIYPLLNYLFGHWWPANPTFGLPCPTTILTFGLLLWTATKVPKYVLIIPLLWALVGVSAAINLHIWEDTVLAAAGIISVIMLWLRDRSGAKSVKIASEPANEQDSGDIGLDK